MWCMRWSQTLGELLTWRQLLDADYRPADRKVLLGQRGILTCYHLPEIPDGIQRRCNKADLTRPHANCVAFYEGDDAVIETVTISLDGHDPKPRGGVFWTRSSLCRTDWATAGVKEAKHLE